MMYAHGRYIAIYRLLVQFPGLVWLLLLLFLVWLLLLPPKLLSPHNSQQQRVAVLTTCRSKSLCD